MSTRLNYIDCAKGLAIILVVLGHIDFGNNPLCNWIYSFHLPLFFIVTGMLMSYKQEWLNKNLIENIKNKFNQLLYPYFIFSIIVILYMLLNLLFFRSGSIGGIIKIFLNTILLDGYSALWFLPALFIAEMVFIFVYRYKYKNTIFIFMVIIGSIGGCFLHANTPLKDIIAFKALLFIGNIFNRALIGSTFIWIGNLIFPKIEKQLNSNKKRVVILVSVFIFIANIIICQFNNLIDLHYSVLNNPVLYYISAICGSISILIIFKFIIVHNSVLEYFGRNSLIVMVTHLPLPVLSTVKILYNATSISIGRYFNDIIICIIVMLIEVIIIECINRYMRFLIKCNIQLFQFNGNRLVKN